MGIFNQKLARGRQNPIKPPTSVLTSSNTLQALLELKLARD